MATQITSTATIESQNFWDGRKAVALAAVAGLAVSAAVLSSILGGSGTRSVAPAAPVTSVSSQGAGLTHSPRHGALASDDFSAASAAPVSSVSSQSAGLTHSPRHGALAEDNAFAPGITAPPADPKVTRGTLP